MVFRSLYFLNRAQLQNSELQLIPWLVEHHRSMGLIKAVRRRHRTNAQRPLRIMHQNYKQVFLLDEKILLDLTS